MNRSVLYRAAGFLTARATSSPHLDATPRVATMSVFNPELTLLLTRSNSLKSTRSTTSSSRPARVLLAFLSAWK